MHVRRNRYACVITYAHFNTRNRRLNGEELEGLKVKELKKLEELINKSLDYVHQAKVNLLPPPITVCWYDLIYNIVQGFNLFNFYFFQVDRHLEEITILKNKVESIFIGKRFNYLLVQSST